jgi:hypothetical protein
MRSAMEIGAHQTQPFTLWHRSTYPLSHATRGTTAVDTMRAHAAVRAGGPQLRTVVTSAVSALVHSGLMEIRHGQGTPSMDPEAYVVRTAVLSGHVRVGPGTPLRPFPVPFPQRR